MNKSEKGGVWTFTLQVDLPVSVQSPSSSSSDKVDEAFRALFLPEIPNSLSRVEKFYQQGSCKSVRSNCIRFHSFQYTGVRSGNKSSESSHVACMVGARNVDSSKD